MVSINHIAMGARNLYAAAFALRDRTGLGFYDGGFNPGGHGNKIFPLGGGAYLQVSGVIDSQAAQTPGPAKRLLDQVRGGDLFQSLNLRADSRAEMDAIARRHGLTAAENATGRTQANGERLRVVSLSATPPGMPSIYQFPDMPLHPSTYPPEAAPGLVRPLGVSFVELGGSAAAIADWIGPDAASLPLRFTGAAGGVTALGVNTARGEIVIRLPLVRA